MKFFKNNALIALSLILITACASTKYGRDPAFDPKYTANNDVLRKTDKFRIKLNKLTALPNAELGTIFLSARLMICFKSANDECRDLGSTDGVDIKPNQSKNFSKEDVKSMKEIYSEVQTGEFINSKLKELPTNLKNSPIYLKIELRRVFSAKKIEVIGFHSVNFPPIEQNPTNNEKILRSVKEFPPTDNFKYGATVELMFLRPQ